MFKHSKGLTYSQIQLDIHTDPTSAPQYLTNTLNLPQLSLQCHPIFLAIHMHIFIALTLMAVFTIF